MDKVRITEIAKELGMKNKDIVDKAVDLGLDVKSHSSSISTEDAEKLMNYILSGENTQANKPATPAKAPEPKKIETAPKAPEVVAPKAPEVIAPKTKTVKEKELESLGKEPLVSKVASSVKAVEEEEDSEDKPDPTNVRQRRGLVIVKKKRPDSKESEQNESVSIVSSRDEVAPARSMESIFASHAAAAAELQKKKKKIKKAPAEKKHSAEKLDIAINLEMSDSHLDSDEEEMIVLPDLNMGMVIPEEVKKKKQIDINIY